MRTRVVAPERPPPALIQPSAGEDPSGHGGSREMETGTQLPSLEVTQVQAVSQGWKGDLPASLSCSLPAVLTRHFLAPGSRPSLP